MNKRVQASGNLFLIIMNYCCIICGRNFSLMLRLKLIPFATAPIPDTIHRWTVSLIASLLPLFKNFKHHLIQIIRCFLATSMIPIIEAIMVTIFEPFITKSEVTIVHVVHLKEKMKILELLYIQAIQF